MTPALSVNNQRAQQCVWWWQIYTLAKLRPNDKRITIAVATCTPYNERTDGQQQQQQRCEPWANVMVVGNHLCRRRCATTGHWNRMFYNRMQTLEWLSIKRMWGEGRPSKRWHAPQHDETKKLLNISQANRILYTMKKNVFFFFSLRLFQLLLSMRD